MHDPFSTLFYHIGKCTRFTGQSPKYLKTFKSPEENIKEYTDNIIRYLRLTNYIYIRGGGYYIDLEPRRSIEIDVLLKSDTGEAKKISKEEWIEYLADRNSYRLPFENESDLGKIYQKIFAEVQLMSQDLGESSQKFSNPLDSDQLKQQIEKLRKKRIELQSKQQKKEFEQPKKIDQVINALSVKSLKNSELKPSIALEKWSSIALNIINDALCIKPNCPMGDDHEPTFTAPANVPDIECYYANYYAVCEVTMLTSREQWYNEGQPVQRHLRKFEDSHQDKPCYCIFIAPSIHDDTRDTFWNAVKYAYRGKKQKIIPLTIKNLIQILKIIKRAKEKGIFIDHTTMMTFYDKCIEVDSLQDSTVWLSHVEKIIGEWGDFNLNPRAVP